MGIGLLEIELDVHVNVLAAAAAAAAVAAAVVAAVAVAAAAADVADVADVAAVVAPHREPRLDSRVLQLQRRNSPAVELE